MVLPFRFQQNVIIPKSKCRKVETCGCVFRPHMPDFITICQFCSRMHGRDNMTLVTRIFELSLHPQIFGASVGCNKWRVIMFQQRINMPSFFVLHNDKAHIEFEKTTAWEYYIRRAGLGEHAFLPLDTLPEICHQEIKILKASLRFCNLEQHDVVEDHAVGARVCIINGLLFPGFDFSYDGTQHRMIVLRLVNKLTNKKWYGFIVEYKRVFKAYRIIETSQKIEIEASFHILSTSFPLNEENSWEIQESECQSVFYEDHELLANFDDKKYNLLLSHNENAVTSHTFMKHISAKQAIKNDTFMQYSDVVLFLSDCGLFLYAINLRGSHPSYICVSQVATQSHYLMVAQKDSTLLDFRAINIECFSKETFLKHVVDRVMNKSLIACDRNQFVLLADAPETVQWQRLLKSCIQEHTLVEINSLRITLHHIENLWLLFTRDVISEGRNKVKCAVVFYCVLKNANKSLVHSMCNGDDYFTDLARALSYATTHNIVLCLGNTVPRRAILPIAICEIP